MKTAEININNLRKEGRYVYERGTIRLFDAESAVFGKSGGGSGISVSEWFKQWLSDSAKNLKISTVALYERYIDNHIAPFFNDMSMADVTCEIIQEFINSKYYLSAGTIRNIAALLKSGFKAAWERDLITPINWKIQLPKNAPKQLRVFSKTEQKRLEKAVRASDNSNLIGVLICLYTGLRIGELCALKWDDISFVNGTLTVNHTMERISRTRESGSRVVILEPKSLTSRRIIPIPAFFINELEEHKKSHCRGEYVINRNGSPIEPRTYQYQFERLLRDAGIEKANFHTLRHTFSTRALEIGFDIKTLSEILGHSSATVTLKLYAHSLDEHKRRSMDKLSKIYI